MTKEVAKTERKNINPVDNQFQKLQPQAVPLEEVVLGALMLDKDALSVIIDFIFIDSFYSDGHKFIYEAILSLYTKNHPIDLMTVNEELIKMGKLESAGGSYYLVELTNRVASTANIEYHARIIQQKAIRRDLIKFHSQGLADAYDDTFDTLELCDKVQKGAFELTNFAGKAVKDIAKLGLDVMNQIHEIQTSNGKGLTGATTGFRDIDKLTKGMQPTNLEILAARPGMGKTSAALKIALNTAKAGNGVAFFSCEMSGVQLMQRLVSIQSGVGLGEMLGGKLTESNLTDITNAIDFISSLPIFIDDTAAISLFELRGKTRRLKMEHDIKAVFIDYLQLMTIRKENSNGGNREQEISAISRGVKAMAKDLEVNVHALSQLSRAVETRGGTKRPQLSDLRESGAIEQDADRVTFIYRPEYYKVIEDENGNSLKGVAEWIVAKNRHGATETILLNFKAENVDFQDMNYSNDNSFPDEEPPAIIVNQNVNISTPASDSEYVPF